MQPHTKRWRCVDGHACHTLRDEDVLMGMQPQHYLLDEPINTSSSLSVGRMGMQPHTKRWRCVDGHACHTHLHEDVLMGMHAHHTLRDAQDVLMGMQPHTSSLSVWCSHTLRWRCPCGHTLRDEDVLMGMQPHTKRWRCVDGHAHTLRDEDVLMGMQPHTKRWRCVDGHAHTHKRWRCVDGHAATH